MANTIGYGQGAVNNTNAWGQGAKSGSSFSNLQSLEFDGIDDTITMGNVLDMANDGTDAFSISCWFKTTNGGIQILAAKQINATPYNGYNLYTNGTAIGFSLGTTSANLRLLGTAPAVTLADGNWHHVAITYDGSQDIGGLTIYYDNTTPTISTVYNNTPTDVSNSADFMIGARGVALVSYGLPFAGNIDEVAYFNSELSASDISTIYGTGAPSDISSISGLVSWWRFEGTGTTATDSGSGGNNGTLTNGVTRSSDVPT